MINYLLYLLNKPKNNWDPISKEYAKEYAEVMYENISLEIVKEVKDYAGSLINKTLLDLGAGPGQFSIAFSQLGAKVTWHDISNNYLELFKNKCNKENINIGNFILDYIDDIVGKYDIIFSRTAWSYCLNDKNFANKIINALEPNGLAYILMHNEDFIKMKKNEISKNYLFRFYLNNLTGIKLGHLYMSKKRIEKLFNKFQLKNIDIIHNNSGLTKIIIKK